MTLKTDWRPLTPLAPLTPRAEIEGPTKSSSGPWIDNAPRSYDALWYERNLPRLSNYAGLWVGIRNQRVVASASSFQGVFQQLSAINLERAFVTRVPQKISERTYLIA